MKEEKETSRRCIHFSIDERRKRENNISPRRKSLVDHEDKNWGRSWGLDLQERAKMSKGVMKSIHDRGECTHS